MISSAELSMSIETHTSNYKAFRSSSVAAIPACSNCKSVSLFSDQTTNENPWFSDPRYGQNLEVNILCYYKIDDFTKCFCSSVVFVLVLVDMLTLALHSHTQIVPSALRITNYCPVASSRNTERTASSPRPPHMMMSYLCITTSLIIKASHIGTTDTLPIARCRFPLHACRRRYHFFCTSWKQNFNFFMQNNNAICSLNES